MKPHPRIRKAIKWGGAAAAAVLVVVWFASAWWGAGYVSRTFVCGIDPGRLVVKSGWDTGISTRTRFEARARRGFEPWRWKIEGEGDWSTLDGKRVPMWDGVWLLIVPLWMPVVCLLLISAVAWRLDVLARRYGRAGKCVRCGYDRAGLAAEAKCPECGSACEQRESA